MARRRRPYPVRRLLAWVLSQPPWWLWVAGLAVAIGWAVDRLLPTIVAVGFVAASGAAVWLRRRLRRPVIADWRDAELATATWLRRAGCRRVDLTSDGADAGIDVLTAEWAVQVKHTERRVGRPAVQQLVGAALSRDRRSALFSTSGFSAPAIDYAREHQVALFELGLDGQARPLNPAARLVGKRLRRIRR